MPRIDMVQNSLADEVSTNRMALQSHAIQECSLGIAIPCIGNRFIDFEVIPPARQFNAIVPRILGELSHFRNGQIRPLTGE
jgi:hypothetical protein